MNINLLYFASVRETVGAAGETLTLDAGDDATVATLLDALRARGGVWDTLLADGNTLKVAVDQRFAAPDTPLTDGCEVALFPPVTGG